MDRALIEEKLESLRRCLSRIENKCPASAEELANDPDIQDIISLNLTRAVQLCVDIAAHVIAARGLDTPATMGQAFDILADAGMLGRTAADAMKRAVGFRNIAVHNYERIDWQIVHALCVHRLDDFRQFAMAVYA